MPDNEISLMDYRHPRYANLVALFELLGLPIGYAEIWGSVPMLAVRLSGPYVSYQSFVHILEFKTRKDGKMIAYYEADRDLSRYFPNLPVQIEYSGPGSYHIVI